MRTRILFVDDEPLVLQGLEDLLFRHRARWEMVFALGAPAALKEIRQEPFDLIVTDMRMPEMDGADLLHVIKNEHPKTVRFVLSGHSQTDATLRTIPVAHQFLHKPCNAHAFETAVERACSLRSLLENDHLRAVVGKMQRLPTVPHSYSLLQTVLREEGSSATDVARIIEQDIGIAAKVLQLVNSSFFYLARPISTVHEAVQHLGYGMIEKLVFATEIFASINLPARSRTMLASVREHSVLTAAIAREILRNDQALSEEAWAAGLLHDVGKLVLASELPDLFFQAISDAGERREPLWKVEKEMYGASHVEVGAYLLGLWGLSPSTINAVAHHHKLPMANPHNPNITVAVYIANSLAHEAAFGEPILDPEQIDALGVSDDIESWRQSARDLCLRGEYAGH